ncbi:PREDICTED: deleted in lung and esophageal cancer protein 1 [Elephantulus edwardii]|uniref:deleted in lung and esophageal cancer protein 1 n=1 Tax=Elephantulus edwardii TaxID=28737 RepID=UPI0003F07C2F|nr:PREDICTED: deleted in lung and esophageal cancer protein 1 [Elephantulus edwardii]
METEGSGAQRAGSSQWSAFPEAPQESTVSRSPRRSTPPSSGLSTASSEGVPRSGQPRRGTPPPEPQLLPLRPTSLRTQDISYVLTRVFRDLYSAEVIGEHRCANLIKGRGSDDEHHERFVDALQQIREVYKKRLDEAEMLERHIIQARARALAEEERVMRQAEAHAREALNTVQLPPVKSVFRWCVDSELLQKHHLISPEDYCSDPVPFCRAPKGSVLPGYQKPTFSSEKRAVPDKELTGLRVLSAKKRAGAEELDLSLDTLTLDLSLQAEQRTKKAVKKPGPPKNKNWMNHLGVRQRELERLLLARMESQNRFLRNPRYFPPNTPYGGKSLVFAPKTPRQKGEFQGAVSEQSDGGTPVFVANPPVAFFTNYEIGPVYEMVIALQNTSSTSRCLRVLPPSTPYFALGLGMFPGTGGMVAPGMTCQYIVQFAPDCLGDFDDCILVDTQATQPLRIPLRARRPPPVLTLPQVLDCGYCLIGGLKVTRFVCRNVGFSGGKFCIMPKRSWPPPSYRAVVTSGFVEQPPFGILPSVFELAPRQAVLIEVIFFPESLEKAEQTFVITCDNCQMKELVTIGCGQLAALGLIYVSGEKSHPEPGELTDLTAQHFIRFEPENLRSTAKKQLIIRNITHVELPFHWQTVKPNLQCLMPGEPYDLESIQCHPDLDTAFSILPERGVLGPHMDHEFILHFSPHKPRGSHSVLQMVLESVLEPVSSEIQDLDDILLPAANVIVLEIEVKGSVAPFQVLLEPYALIIPGENYIGTNVKKDFKMWNNSKSPIRYTWEKISDCHIVEVEPCAGVIEPNEVGDFEVSFTGGAPGAASQDLLCEIQDSPSPVVLHIEAAFKGPAVVINVSALQLGLLRLGQKVTQSIQIQNVSQLPATWRMQESRVCLEERLESESPLDIEPPSGQLLPLGQCTVDVTFTASLCRSLRTVLELEVENGPWSHLPVYAEVQKPYVYLKSSHLEVTNLYVGVPTHVAITLINGTLLPSQFQWDKLLGHQADLCTVTVSPECGVLGPSEELSLDLELTTHTQEELTSLALLCHVSGMQKPVALAISGKAQGLQVSIAIAVESPPSSTEQWPGRLEELRLDFGSSVPLRTQVNGQLILTNHSPIQTPFTLNFEYFGSAQSSLNKKASIPDMAPALLRTARIREQLAKREEVDFMESMLAHGKGAAFSPHISQGILGAHQRLSIGIAACANMWGEYWDNLVCLVGDLPPAIIPVHMAVAGCPISSQRTPYTAGQAHKEPIIRFGTLLSGGNAVTRVIRLHNSSPCDIRLDWQTYVPEEKEDRLLELLVFYGPPFPLRDQEGNEIVCPETPETSSPWSPCLSGISGQDAAQSDENSDRHRAPQKIISVILQEHSGVPSEHLYSLSPKQLVVPARDSRTVCVSFTPMVLSPDVLNKVECTGYALGFMSLDSEVERDIPQRRRRLQDFAVGPLRLDLHGCVRSARLSVELDYDGGMTFYCQASDLIPEEPHTGVLRELVSTHHLKLNNPAEIPHGFRLRVSAPFSASPGEAGFRAPVPEHREEEEEEEGARTSGLLVLRPRENMLVNVSFSLSRELLYPKLPADQMLTGVQVRQSASGEREVVFTQDLLLEYTNQTTQVVPLRAVVAVPELQVSTSWVDFGTCVVNQQQVREVHLMNLSCCRSYWTVLMGEEEPARSTTAFQVSPNSGMLEARPVNAPPPTVTLQVTFTARSNELYESTLVVDGVLGEKACALWLRGKGFEDKQYVTSLASPRSVASPQSLAPGPQLWKK